MPYIGRDLNRGNYLKLDDISSSFNGSTQTFNLTVGGSAFTPGSAFSILVSVGGVIQEPESAYQVNNSEITFANAPTAQDSFFCIALGVSLGIGVPGNGTVNGTQMAKPFNYDGFFYLDDANNRVGIGSLSPTVALDVIGSANISGDTSIGRNVNVTGILTAASFNGGSGGINAGVVTCTGLDVNGNGDVSGNFVIGGDLTVNGTTSTIDTNLIGVDKIEVTTASSNVAVAVTHNGSGDLVRLYDGTSQVVTVDDVGQVGLGTAIPDEALQLGNNKKIHLGLDGIKAYHTGSVGYINNYNGILKITGADGQKIDFVDASNGYYARFNSGDSCELHFGGSGSRIVTKSYGAFVNGELRLTTGGSGYTFLNDPDTGMHNPSDGNLHFRVNGTDRIFIKSNGRVGVGITNPDSYFSSYNNLVVGNSSDTGGITIVSQNGSGASIAFAKGTSGNQTYRGLIRYDNGNDKLQFNTNANTGQVTIDNGGNLGVGTDTPRTVLHLHDSTNTRIQFTDNGTGAASGDGVIAGLNGDDDFFINNRESGKGIKFFTGSDDMRMFINSDGDVLINTVTTPSADIKLLVNGNGGVSSGSYFSFRGDYGNVPEPAAYAIKFDSSINRLHQYAYGGIAFNLGGQPRITFTQAGLVGIGTTNPNNPLTIHGSSNHIYLKDTATDNNLQIRHSSGVAEFNSFGTGGARRPFVFNQYATEVFRIDSDGQVQIGSGTIHGGGHLTIRGGGVNTYASQDYQYVGTPGNDTALGQLRFTANTTGASVVQGAKIQAVSDAAWSATGDAPTRLEFHTAPDGSATMQERLRIDTKSTFIGAGGGTEQIKIESQGGGAGIFIANFQGVDAGDASSRLGVGKNDNALIFMNASGSQVQNFAIGTTDSVPLVFSTHNTKRIVITGDGKVGINVTPTQMFEVVTDFGLADNLYKVNTSYRSGNNASGYTASGLQITSSADNSNGEKHTAFLQFSNRDPALNGSHGASAFITMSTPSGTGTYGTGQFDFYCRNGAPYAFPNDPQASSSYWMDSLFTIKSNGNVGVADTNPAAKFTVNNGTNDAQFVQMKNDNVGLFFGAYGTGHGSYPREATINGSRTDAGSSPYLRLAGQGGIRFCVDLNSERMRIDSGGKIKLFPYVESGGASGTPLYLQVQTDMTAPNTPTGGSDSSGLFRIEDRNGTNNRYHGIDLRNRNSGDVRILNQDLGATNAANLVFAVDDSGQFTGSGTIREYLRIASNGVTSVKTLSGNYYPVASARDGSTSARAASSAWEIKKTLGAAARTGYYYLKDMTGTVAQWWCDMETDGGGWILIAHHGEGTMADQGTTGAQWWHATDRGGFDTVSSGFKIGGGYWRGGSGEWAENTCGQLMWDVRVGGEYGFSQYGYHDNSETNSKVVFNWGTDQAIPTGNSGYSNIPNASNRRFNEWCYEVQNAPGYNPGNYHQNQRSNIISGNNYFTEHLVMTWSFRNTSGAADEGEGGPYWMIGVHANGLHQHYEESLSGDSTGDGEYQVVSHQDSTWQSNAGGVQNGMRRLSKISSSGFCNIWMR